MDRFRGLWANLAGKLGLTFCLFGFIAIFLGWNGAASYDRVPAQFPWLISGGITGLSLVVIGAAMLVVENNRRDQAALRATLEELRLQLEHSPSAVSSNGGFARPAPTTEAAALPDNAVVAGASSYHDPSCRLVGDRPDLDVIDRSEAEDRDLTPCRICNPASPQSTPRKAASRRTRRPARR